MNRLDGLQERLAGPLASIRTPFTPTGEMDVRGLARMVDFDVAAGAAGLLITWGDSLFALLSDRDIGDLTRAVVECAAGRVPVVACTGRWATPQAVAFAEFCATAGADLLQVFLPMWYPGSLTPEAALEHHRALAQHLPLMTNSAELQRLGPQAGLQVAETLMERPGEVPAMKADVMGDFDRRLTSLVSDRWIVMAGGQKAFHLELWPYGCQAYLSTFVTFMPEVTRTYWRAIEAGDPTGAAGVIERLDRPFFDHILTVPGGFDAAMHGLMELCGLTERWRRPPFYSLSDAEMEELAGFLAGLQDRARLQSGQGRTGEALGGPGQP